MTNHVPNGKEKDTIPLWQEYDYEFLLIIGLCLLECCSGPGERVVLRSPATANNRIWEMIMTRSKLVKPIPGNNDDDDGNGPDP